MSTFSSEELASLRSLILASDPQAGAELLCGTIVTALGVLNPECRVSAAQLGELVGKAFAIHRTAVLLTFIDRMNSLLMRNLDHASAQRLMNSARLKYALGSEDSAKAFFVSAEQILTILESTF